MTNSVLTRGDERITEAGIEGIGSLTAERLEAAGIASVDQLAEADVSELADSLAGSFPRLKAETLRQRVGRWVALAGDRIRGGSARATRGHVFLLTLWADADGTPLRSRFGYRNPDEPTSEETSLETVGWSPLAFASFVEHAAGLQLARRLSEERAEHTKVVEWSKHHIEGHLVRGGTKPVEIRSSIPTADLEADAGRIRWRASGRLVPFGGRSQIVLGTCSGTVARGDPIEFTFGTHAVPDSVHRASFDLMVSPPTGAKAVPGDVGNQR